MKKSVLICYFSSVSTLLMFTISVMYNWIPAAVICGLLFAGCLVWFCKLIEKGEKWSYRHIRRIEKRLYGDDCIEEQLQAIRKELAGKADKKVDISNVRPGSRPSDKYKAMVGGEVLDSGRKD